MRGRLLPVLLLLLLFLGILLAMRAGWRSRARAQAQIPPPPDDPLELLDGGTADGPFDGVYVCTVRGGSPLDRIVVHGLGERSPVRISRGTAGSWRLERTGAPSFTIPADAVTDVASASAMAGKAMGGDGLLVVRWRHGPDHLDLDTGLRLARRADHDLLLTRKEHP